MSEPDRVQFEYNLSTCHDKQKEKNVANILLDKSQSKIVSNKIDFIPISINVHLFNAISTRLFTEFFL